MEPEHFCIATTAAGGEPVVFTDDERARHVYLVGKSGSGKSTLLFNLAMLDILAGEGVTIIDPHGDLAEAIADRIPSWRTNDVCYLNVADTERPVGFNPLAGVAPHRRALAAAGMVSAFKHLWGDSWGPRLEHFLYHGLSALLDRRHATLIDLPRLYTDERFRRETLRLVRDPITHRFWEEEFAGYDQRFRTEAIAPILNKAGQFATSPNVRAIIGQTSPKFDLAFAMDNHRIIIANLAKGVIGEQASNLLGSLLVSHLQLVAMGRSTIPEDKRAPFFIHVDEFQSFGTDAFASLMSEARKYGAHFCLSHQFTDQIAPHVRAAVLGNAGTLIVFRVGGADAALLAPEFHPMEKNTLAAQLPFKAWLRRAASGDRYPIDCASRMPLPSGRLSTVIAQSRRNFGRTIPRK
jgi:energy-coupling factor transporter ATP-binding protein EcfA2